MNEHAARCPQCGADPRRGFTKEESEAAPAAPRPAAPPPAPPPPLTAGRVAHTFRVALTVALAFSLAIAGLVVLIGLAHHPYGLDYFALLPPLLLLVVLWGAVPGFALAMVERLEGGEGGEPAPLSWVWPLLGVAVAVALAHVAYWDGLMHYVDPKSFAADWTDRVLGGAWSLAVITTVVVLAEAIRVVLGARRRARAGAARGADAKVLLWTAAAQAVGFILANACLSFVLLIVLLYAHTEHD